MYKQQDTVRNTETSLKAASWVKIFLFIPLYSPDIIQDICKLMLIETPGEPSGSEGKAASGPPPTLHVTDVVKVPDVPLLILRKRIEHEANAQKKESLKKQLDDLTRVSESRPPPRNRRLFTQLYFRDRNHLAQ